MKIVETTDNKPKLIRNWDELKNIPQESNTHILEIDRWNREQGRDV